jgi:hypothetical protein
MEKMAQAFSKEFRRVCEREITFINANGTDKHNADAKDQIEPLLIIVKELESILGSMNEQFQKFKTETTERLRELEHKSNVESVQ